MKFVIARTATRNPQINGRTLYWTQIGFWTLDPACARKFETRSAAEVQCNKDLEGCRVEEVQS